MGFRPPAILTFRFPKPLEFSDFWNCKVYFPLLLLQCKQHFLKWFWTYEAFSYLLFLIPSSNDPTRKIQRITKAFRFTPLWKCVWFEYIKDVIGKRLKIARIVRVSVVTRWNSPGNLLAKIPTTDIFMRWCICFLCSDWRFRIYRRNFDESLSILVVFICNILVFFRNPLNFSCTVFIYNCETLLV